MPGMEDRLLVEKLLNTCLVPYNLESADRMKKLYLLFSTIDENASKAFIEVQTKQEKIHLENFRPTYSVPSLFHLIHHLKVFSI